MKKIKKFIILSIILQLFIFLNVGIDKGYCKENNTSYCVMEVSSKRIISSSNENVKLPMASTTKILTCLTVIENFDVNKSVIVPKSCVGVEGSSIYLKENDEYKVIDLLYGLMLRSGNDCAKCLQDTLSPNEEEFILLMNNTAKKCGAENSNFVNPHGLHDDNHYTTAKDLCLISSYALQNPTFRKIVSSKSYKIINLKDGTTTYLKNKNKMLFNYEGATGIKTGYTKKAGRCLVSSAKKENMEVVSVVLNCPDMWEKSTELLDNALNGYQITKLFDKDDFNSRILENSKCQKFKFLAFKDFYYPISKLEGRSLKYVYDGKSYEEFIKNPKENFIFEIFLENELIFSQNIFTILLGK